MENEIKNLVSLLKQTFEKGAWHGPSVQEALEKISESDAFKRLPHTHSILELIAHMTAWRIYAIKKLEGDSAYQVTADLNFPEVKNWEEAVQRLKESQQLLLSALEIFPAKKLSEQVPGKETPLTYYTLVHGIIHHDLYHTGQIMLIEKANSTQTF